MSGYMTSQGLVKTLLTTLPSLANNGVTEGDARVLESGRDNCAILFPGAVVSFDTEENATEHLWECLCDIFQRFKIDDDYRTFGTFRDDVIALLNTGAALSSDYMIINVRSNGEPSDFVNRTSGATFAITQQLVITIREYVF